MLNLLTASVIFSLSIPIALFVIIKLKTIFKSLSTSSTNPPKSYSLINSLSALLQNKERFIQWTSELVTSTPTLTVSVRLGLRPRTIVTADPAAAHHILKSHFHNYGRGESIGTIFTDLFGNGLFNADGENWKFQRQIFVHEFKTKSFRKFIETMVDFQISERLIPILETAAVNKTVLDFQDILQRFAFDNICKIAFSYDPGYLSASLPQAEFADVFQKAVELTSCRFAAVFPMSWKIKKALNIGSEKQLKIAVSQIREFTKKIIREKKQEILGKSSLDHPFDDLLSRFLTSGHSDEKFVMDIVISFILAGQDTTVAALSWFFWLLSDHPQVENEILKEINAKSNTGSIYDEVKEMIYTHAALCESMRLYPPVPIVIREALNDDILPDGTIVKKGMTIKCHPYAMGRAEKVWGKDWKEFRPERWLERDVPANKWNFVNKDAYTYLVFNAGPRTCVGKDTAFIQMKKVVTSVLRRFRVVPLVAREVEPAVILSLTVNMKDGLPVRIEPRV